MIDRAHKIFYLVGLNKSFTKAARIMYISQPAVSQQIKILENKYGNKLIELEGKNVRMTEEGTRLFFRIEEGLELEEKLKSDLDPKRGRKYNIGATLTIGEYVMPELLGNYSQEYTDEDIIMQVENTEIITQLLYERKILLGFVEGEFNKRLFEYSLYKKDEMILVGAKDSGLASRGEINGEELLKEKLILREKGSGTRKSFEDEMISRGFSMNEFAAYMSIGSLTAIKRMVLKNLGYTIISRLAVEEELKEGRLVEIKTGDLKFFREFNFICNKNEVNPFVSKFVEYCLKGRKEKNEL